MIKKLQIIVMAALLAGAPLGIMAEELCDGPETETTAITMSVSGSNVRINGANGETLEIYNLAGVKVASYRIDSDSKTISLSFGKGYYFLKVGNVVRKVSIR